MKNSKLFIVLIIVIAAGVFIATKVIKTEKSTPVQQPVTSPTLTPFIVPIPTREPISDKSNLYEQSQKIEMPDYAEDFKLLRDGAKTY